MTDSAPKKAGNTSFYLFMACMTCMMLSSTTSIGWLEITLFSAAVAFGFLAITPLRHKIIRKRS